MTADSEKFSASLEQIENHQKQLEQELADKGIDGRETMEYLLEKVTNRSNMPVFVYYPYDGMYWWCSRFYYGQLPDDGFKAVLG